MTTSSLLLNFALFFLQIYLMYRMVYKKKNWGIGLILSVSLCLQSISIVKSILLDYSSVEVVGTTDGYVSMVKSGATIKYYFTYNGQIYTSSCPPPNDKFDKIIKLGGKYIVKVSTIYPNSNKIDFDRPVILGK